jgi:hypothetical protein
MVFAFITALDFPYFRAQIAPLTISAIVFVLAVAALVKELRATKKLPSAEAKEKAEAKPEERRRTLVEAAWLVGFTAAIFVLGFVLGVFAFSAGYARSGGARWTTSIAVAVAVTLSIWLMSSVLLDFRLYPGLIPDLLGISL